MKICSIRGAITIDENTEECILKNTQLLLQKIINENNLNIKQILNIFFSSTIDINKIYPAVAARNLGITQAGIMCMQEMFVENSLKMCIRVLINATDISQDNVKHIYLNDAKILRPDLVAKKIFSITIDGPAGSGKSTVARLIAKKINFIYVDTGAMYRAIAYYCLKNNIFYLDPKNVIECLKNINIVLDFVGLEQHIILNNENVTANLRTQEISKVASIISKIPDVREKLVKIQKNIAKNKNVVMDGRDTGTNVLPNANLKIYMDANIDERVKRRLNEFKEKGKIFTHEYLKKQMIKRDNSDKNRDINPLKKAKDAIFIDTTNLSIEEVSEKILKLIKENIE